MENIAALLHRTAAHNSAASPGSLTLFVVVLGVMTRMGPWGKVLVTVRDQRGERVDRMGRLHNGDFVGLRREMQESFKMTQRSSSSITDKLGLQYWRDHRVLF